MLFVLLLVKLQLLLHSKFHFLFLVRWKFILFGGHVGDLFWCCFLVFFLFFFNFNVLISAGFFFYRLNSNYACSSFSDRFCVGAFWWQSVVSQVVFELFLGLNGLSDECDFQAASVITIISCMNQKHLTANQQTERFYQVYRNNFYSCCT